MTIKERREEFNRLAAHYANGIVSPALVKWLNENGFFTSPASTKYHGVYPGGLYDHSKAVFDRLIWMTNMLNITWQRPESPFITGMFHDLCKCDQYRLKPEIKKLLDEYPEMRDEIKLEYEYNTDTLLKGHGAKSVLILSQFMVLTEEEMLCIRYHMGPYEKEEWPEYDLAIRRHETVLLTHTADMYASKVDGT